MLPRANGKLVTYPNNVAKPFVFDLNEKKIIAIDKDTLSKQLTIK